MISHGARQDCPLSPLLFNICDEELMRKAMQNCQDSIAVGGKLLQAVRFSADQATLADRKKDFKGLWTGWLSLQRNLE